MLGVLVYGTTGPTIDPLKYTFVGTEDAALLTRDFTRE